MSYGYTLTQGKAEYLYLIKILVQSMWISEVGFNLLKQLSFQFLQEDGLTHTLYQFSSPCQVYQGDQMPTALPPHSYQVCSLSAVGLPAHSLGFRSRFFLHFYRAMLSMHGTSHGPVSVCPCLTQVGVLLKRINVGSQKQEHRTISRAL